MSTFKPEYTPGGLRKMHSEKKMQSALTEEEWRHHLGAQEDIVRTLLQCFPLCDHQVDGKRACGNFATRFVPNTHPTVFCDEHGGENPLTDLPNAAQLREVFAAGVPKGKWA